MAVHNGAENLPAQLESIKAQTWERWKLLASDDQSTDESRAILDEFASSSPAVIYDGPGKGFVANFMSLLTMPNIDGLVALSDQDDVWFPNKLERAQRVLSALDPDQPALYCSRRINWWPDTNERRLSRSFPKPPSFTNALVENLATGNTIVINDAALRLVRATADRAADTPFHDWWLYLLITGAGGIVVHDAGPSLLYRQHNANLIGQGEGFLASLRVKRAVLDGSYSDRIDRNLLALMRIRDFLTEENRRHLDAFSAARKASLLTRFRLMRRSGAFRQGRFANLGFWGAVCLGKV